MLAGAALATIPASAQSPKIGDPPEAKNMRLVGYNDLQERSAYEPTIHHQGNRYIAYIGHHGGTPEAPKPVNKLTGQPEFNGTSIVDVTDPAHPNYLAHIPGTPGNYEEGGAQMTRVCDGKTLPKGDPDKTYLLRVYGGKGHEIYDVTDPSKPQLIWHIEGLKDTHKSFWECDTGIAYLVSGVKDWRVRRMTEVYDISDPYHPVKIRDFGLVGQQPGATGPIPVDLHGMISLPQSNRIYFGYGTNKGGVLQIVDREKLLKGPKEPTPENLRYPEVGRLEMSPFNGAHTVFPMMKMPIAEFAKDTEGATRDFVMIVDEQIRNECQEPRQMAWFVDVTDRIASDDGVEFPGAGGERSFLRPRRAFRHAFVEREHGAGVLQQGRVADLLQCRCARGRCPRSISSQGDRLLHPLDHRGDRQALHQGRRQGPLQGRDPEQQCRDRRPWLHLCRRPHQYRDARPRIDRRCARGCGIAPQYITSPRARGEVVARSAAGEGASPRF